MQPHVLNLPPDALPELAPIFQAGIQVPTRIPCPLWEAMTRQWGVEEAYVRDRISTIFLNGKPVDDLEGALLREGSTVALSCAMPGLVGATMRRGGVVSGFRSGITHRDSGPMEAEHDGWVTVKLFNMLIRELGPIFLRRGIWLESGRLPERLKALLPECEPAAETPERARIQVFMT
jgi:hypothetical protein